MSNPKDFELPSATEKLSSKFILDALRPKAQLMSEMGTEVVSEPEEEMRSGQQLELESCGTVAEMEEVPAAEDLPMTAAEPADQYSGIALPKEKKYFRIGEVSELIGVEPHVLRYWESEFKKIKPSKTGSGQRVYSRKDVETLHYIRHLLHVEKFSIKGARKKLSEQRKTQDPGVALSPEFWEKRNRLIKESVHELKELVQMLRHDW